MKSDQPKISFIRINKSYSMSISRLRLEGLPPFQKNLDIRFYKKEDLLKFKEQINCEIDSFLKTIKEETDTESFRKEYCENTD